MSQSDSDSSTHKYRYTVDITPVTKQLKALLMGLAGLSLLALLVHIVRLNLVLSGAWSKTHLATAYQIDRVVWQISVPIYIVVFITFLTWVYRANLNCHGFGAQGMQFSPGWSVVWYFVPILNCYKPYQAMVEIWKVSTDPERWRDVPDTPFIGWWWSSWVLSAALGWGIQLTAPSIKTLDEFKQIMVAYIIFDIVDILFCIFTVMLVSAVWQKQENLVRRR